MKKFLIISLFIAGVAIRAMEFVEPMEIEPKPNRVPALRQLGLAAVARQLPTLFKNADGANRIATLPEELRQELWHHHMFGSDENKSERNPAVLWLLSQCPIFKRIKDYHGVQFAEQRRECNNMRVIIDGGIDLRVINVQTEELLCEFTAGSAVQCAQFSSDGNHLYLILYDRRIVILGTQTWDIVHTAEIDTRLRYPGNHLFPDNAAVLCGSLNCVLVHDALTGEPIADLVRSSDDFIESVKLSHDGNNVYVFFEGALDFPDDQIVHIDEAIVPLKMKVHRFDISALNQVLAQLPRLTLEQLLALRIVYKIARTQEPVEMLAHRHIRAGYDALPANIRAIIEEQLPGVDKQLHGKRDGGESDQKRRKVALKLMNGGE